MSRPDRWWRPSTARRPAQRARARRMYSGKDLDKTFEVGYEVGKAAAEKRTRKRDDLIHRLSEAAEQGPDAVEELARQVDAEEERRWWSDDDVTDLAQEVGVLDDEEDKALWDSVPDPAESVVVEIEQWLAQRDDWLRWLREQGDAG